MEAKIFHMSLVVVIKKVSRLLLTEVDKNNSFFGFAFPIGAVSPTMATRDRRSVSYKLQTCSVWPLALTFIPLKHDANSMAARGATVRDREARCPMNLLLEEQCITSDQILQGSVTKSAAAVPCM